jgi:hypothetical protein
MIVSLGPMLSNAGADGLVWLEVLMITDSGVPPMLLPPGG